MNYKVDNLSVKLFADGADLEAILELAKKPFIKGFTTNPTLMRKAGVKNYRNFAIEVLDVIDNKPISFEVFSDDLDEMVNQGLEISSWGKNVNVKIPITNSKGKSTESVIKILSERGVSINVTAVMTLNQVQKTVEALDEFSKSYISIFAGRIADTGVDPVLTIKQSLEIIQAKPNIELIWASPRELLNVFQANDLGCHIITATTDILNKLNLVGKDLTQYSLETVKMFYDDALKSGFTV